MKKALLLCLGITILLFGMDDPTKKGFKKEKSNQLKVLDKQLIKIDQQYKKAKNKKKREQAFLYGQIIVSSQYLLNEFLVYSSQGDVSALSKVYVCEANLKQINYWAKQKGIVLKIDFPKLSCKICESLIEIIKDQLKENVDEENNEKIYHNLNQLIIRTKSFFTQANITKKTAQKAKLFNRAEQNYQEAKDLFALLHKKTDDKRAQEGAAAIALMLSKIE